MGACQWAAPVFYTGRSCSSSVVLLLLVQIPAGIAMIAPGLGQGSIDRLFVLHKGLGVVLLVVVAQVPLYDAASINQRSARQAGRTIARC